MSEMGLHSSPRYLGAIPRKDLYTITQIMNNTRRGQMWTDTCYTHVYT